MSTLDFWKDVAERAGKTAAQAALTLITANYTNLFHLHWSSIGEAVAGSAVFSVLTSLASAGAKGDASPSLVAAPVTADAVVTVKGLDKTIEPGAD
jgi:r1t holin